MKPLHAITTLLCLRLFVAQQRGTLEQEGNPTITLKECTLSGGCTSRQARLTLDANWRWLHDVDGATNCYTGDQWDSDLCSDPVTCATTCALEGVSLEKYQNTYGIQQVEDGVKMTFVTEHAYGTNVGSRLYVLDTDDNYELFYLKNREFSLEIDVSELQCGMNGAMYFTEMDISGGMHGNNNAGAMYGTGYCDAQCPHDIKFIDGEANVLEWESGVGKYGACCAELDIWEANSMATAFTPHTCDIEGQLRCEGIDCGNGEGQRYAGICDKDGCDMNPFRMGNTEFYGRGSEYIVDTTRPMTVVTQFLTTDGTDTGDLSDIRRFYIQNGQVLESPSSTILGAKNSAMVNDDFCEAKKELFDDVNDFQDLGGMKGMGDSLDRGHVMIFSLWDDIAVNMLWLDSAYPLDKPVTDPGVKRGDCPGGVTSTPTYLRQTYPDGYVTFKNAAVGEIGSTVTDTLAPAGSPVSSPSNKIPTAAPVVPFLEPTVEQIDESQGYCCFWSSMNQPCSVCETKASASGWCSVDSSRCAHCNGNWCSESTPAIPPTDSPVTSPSNVAPVLPTDSPVSPPTSVAPTSKGCFSQNYKDCLPAEYLSRLDESCNTMWLPNGAPSNCVALWGECTGETNSCCGFAECLGDNSYSACVPMHPTEAPVSSTSKAPTQKPTTEKPTTEKPTTEKPTTEKPTTEKPTAAPTTSCKDDPDWRRVKNGNILTNQNCVWVSQWTIRCGKTSEGVSVSDGCPVTCNTCPTSRETLSPTRKPTLSSSDMCKDSTTWTRNTIAWKDCSWVKKKTSVRCTVTGDDSTVASESCPESCNTCST